MSNVDRMPSNHDLLDFMSRVTSEMSSEYERIQKRASEDPGTAGDQGEENWAALLREWLPAPYQVVTKGRILSELGVASPQVDVLVLHPYYPRYLLDKKLYLAGGVVAAFECKITLKAEHIRTVIENSVKIRNLLPRRNGTPYKELYSPIVYGLLAHSHVWKNQTLGNTGYIDSHLVNGDLEFVKHPREMLDVVCVADLANWISWKMFSNTPFPDMRVSTAYMRHTTKEEDPPHSAIPIGDMLSRLLRRLAWEDTSLRVLAHYFFAVPGLTGREGAGWGRTWPNSVFSDITKTQIEKSVMKKAKPERWDEWDPNFEFLKPS